jgi:signal transduction histidine kinase
MTDQPIPINEAENPELEKAISYPRIKWLVIFTVFFFCAFTQFMGVLKGAPLLASYLSLIIAAAANLFLQHLISRERPYAFFAFISLMLDMIIIITALYLTGGPENTWGFLPIVAIFFAGYIFNIWFAFLFALMGSLGMALMFWLEYASLLPHFSAYGFPPEVWKNRNYIIDYISGLSLLYFLGAAISANFSQLLKHINQVLSDLLDKLEKNYEKLQAADKAKTEFLSLVSHELRFPLTPIMGYIGFILEGKLGELNAEQKNALEIIKEQSRHLHALIDSVLDISRFELGKPIPIRRELLSLKEIIKDVAAAIAIQAKGQNLKISLQLPDDLSMIIGDEIKMKRILTNLLGNAMKFTPPGGEITVKAYNCPPEVRVEVIDNGIGIAPDNLSKIFEKFFQVEVPTEEISGGIGMGLTICRELIKLHNGKIWAESDGLGKGSKFIFTLPTAEAQT